MALPRQQSVSRFLMRIRKYTYITCAYCHINTDSIAQSLCSSAVAILGFKALHGADDDDDALL